MLEAQENLLNYERFFNDRCQTSLAATFDKAVEILRSEFGPSEHLHSGEYQSWVAEIYQKLESLEPSVVSEQDISKSLRAADAIKFVAGVCELLESNVQDFVFGFSFAYDLGRAADSIDKHYDCRFGVDHSIRSTEARLATLDTINAKKRATIGNPKQQALDAIKRAQRENPSRAEDADFIKEQAAKSLGIKKRALYDRLK